MIWFLRERFWPDRIHSTNPVRVQCGPPIKCHSQSLLTTGHIFHNLDLKAQRHKGTKGQRKMKKLCASVPVLLLCLSVYLCQKVSGSENRYKKQYLALLY